MREEKIEYEMKLAEISAQGEWIVADTIKKLDDAGYNKTLAAYALFLHGVVTCFSSMDPYEQADLLDIMDRFTVERLSELIQEGIDIDKTPFVKSDEERGL